MFLEKNAVLVALTIRYNKINLIKLITKYIFIKKADSEYKCKYYLVEISSIVNCFNWHVTYSYIFFLTEGLN